MSGVVRKRVFPFLALPALAGCALFAGPPPRPLTAGYYTSGGPAFKRRLIVYAGGRDLSYDVWRISPTTGDEVDHLHFDLVGETASPMTGRYFVTQDGTDCGHAYVENTAYPGEMALFYGGWIGTFVADPRLDPTSYDQDDAALNATIISEARSDPHFVSKLTYWQRDDYAQLLPTCTYD